MASTTELNNPHVFMSYARVDSAFADDVLTVLENYTIKVLLDTHQIDLGERWRERLNQLIADADSVVFLMTSNSIVSEYCKEEILEAERLGKRIFPLRYDSNVAAPGWISEWQILDMSDAPTRESNLGRLIEDLKRDVGWRRKVADLTKRAELWRKNERAEDRAIRGEELDAANSLVIQRPRFESELPDFVLTFLNASQDAERAEKLRLRRAIGKAFVQPAQHAYGKHQFAKSLRYTLAGAILADDPDFEIVPELLDVAQNAAYCCRDITVFGPRITPGHMSCSCFFNEDRTKIGVPVVKDGVCQIQIWRDSGEIESTFSTRNIVSFADFLMDGTVLVTEPDGWSKYDPSNGDLIHRVEWEPGSPRRALSRVGKTLAVQLLDRLQVWNTSDGSLITEFVETKVIKGQGPADPEVERLLDEMMANLAQGAELIASRPTEDTTIRRSLSGVSMSDDGSHVAIGVESRITILSLQDDRKFTVKGIPSSVIQTCLSPTGDRVLSIHDDGSLYFSRPKNAKNSRWSATRVAGDLDDDAIVRFSAKGKLAIIGNRDGSFQIINGSDGTIMGHGAVPQKIVDVRVSNDEKQLLVATETAVLLQDVLDPQNRLLYCGHDSSIRGADFGAEENHIVACGNDGEIRVWKCDDIKPNRKLASLDATVTGVGFSPNDKHIVSCSFDSQIKVCDTSTGKTSLVTHLDRKHPGNRSVQFSTDGTKVQAACEDGTVDIISLDSEMHEKFDVKMSGKQAHRTVLIGNGTQVLVSSRDGSIQRLSINETEALCEYPGLEGSVSVMDVAESGNLLVAVAKDGTVHSWALDSGNLLGSIKSSPAESVSVSPCGNRIAIAFSDAAIEIWDSKLSTKFASNQSGHRAINSLKFSNNGRAIVSGGYEGMARVWNAEHGNLIVSHIVAHDEAIHVCFSNSGRELVVCRDNGAICLLNIDYLDVFTSENEIASIIARLNGGLGTKSGADIDDLLLSEVPDDLRQTALEQWPWLEQEVVDGDKRFASGLPQFINSPDCLNEDADTGKALPELRWKMAVVGNAVDGSLRLKT